MPPRKAAAKPPEDVVVTAHDAEAQTITVEVPDVVDEVVVEDEAAPPPGVVLDEPALDELIGATEGETPAVEATESEMAALLRAAQLDQLADPEIVPPVAPVRDAWAPFVGAMVYYVAARADLDRFGPAHAPGDVVPALVIGVDGEHLDLRAFPRCEGVPFIGGAPLRLDPGEITLDHQGWCFRPSGAQ